MKKNFLHAIVWIVILTGILSAAGCTERMGKEPQPSINPSVTETIIDLEPSNTPGETKSQTAPGTTEPTASNTPAPPPSATSKPGTGKKQPDFTKLAPTTVMSFSELVGDNGDYKSPKDYPPDDTYKIVVNIYYQFITVYKKDANGKFSVPVRYMICSTGSRKTPTPTGKFKMGTARNRFSEFVTYKVFGQYWSQIVNSIFFHSILYTKKNAKTYTTSSYRNLGRRVSHGCIRMLVPDARWIYYNAAPGTVVEIIRGRKDSKQAAIKKKLTRAKLPSRRPNLVKGKIPVTEPWPGYKK